MMYKFKDHRPLTDDILDSFDQLCFLYCISFDVEVHKSFLRTTHTCIYDRDRQQDMLLGFLFFFQRLTSMLTDLPNSSIEYVSYTT